MKHLLTFVVFASFSTVTAAETKFTGTVKSVQYGDAIIVSSSDGPKSVHLRGTDAPDKDQKHWAESKSELSRLIEGQTVEVRWEGKHKAGHLMGEVLLKGKSINLKMIEAGLALYCPEQIESKSFALAHGARISANRLSIACRPCSPYP